LDDQKGLSYSAFRLIQSFICNKLNIESLLNNSSASLTLILMVYFLVNEKVDEKVVFHYNVFLETLVN